MRIFNLFEGVWGTKGTSGVWLGTPADNLLYENRNSTELLQSYHPEVPDLSGGEGSLAKMIDEPRRNSGLFYF